MSLLPLQGSQNDFPRFSVAAWPPWVLRNSDPFLSGPVLSLARITGKLYTGVRFPRYAGSRIQGGDGWYPCDIFCWQATTPNCSSRSSSNCKKRSDKRRPERISTRCATELSRGADPAVILAASQAADVDAIFALVQEIRLQQLPVPILILEADELISKRNLADLDSHVAGRLAGRIMLAGW